MTSIIRKEVRELLTPGSVISVLVMVVLFAGLGGLIGGEVDSAAELPSFGLIAEEGVVVVHGSGFDPEFGSGHFRTITLPPMETLEEAYDKIERFIKRNTY